MPRQIVILGAGISGLTAAWKIQRRLGAEASITLIEKSPRVGGWIQSLQKEEFLFEQGPRSCRSHGTGAATLQLIEELGLQNQVIIAEPPARFRYLYTAGALRRLPHNLISFLFSPLMKGVIPALWHEWLSPPKEGDESIYDFFSRRFSPQLAQQFIDPLVTGIYAGDIRQLSIQSCFPVLYSWVQQHGSVLRGSLFHKKERRQISPFVRKIGRSPLFSLQGGMESLTRALVDQLQAVIRFNSAAKEFSYEGDGAVVTLESGERIWADHLISTLPSRELHYASVAVINVGYRKSVLRQKGFGYLIPSKEQESILGCVWDSSVFPSQNRQDSTVLSVMMGGAHYPEIEWFSERQCIEVALEALERHLGISAQPDVTAFKLAKEAIPQYPVGHSAWAGKRRTELPAAMEWIGTAFGGVSVNDCIATPLAILSRGFDH